MAEFTIRKAGVKDAKRIQELINTFARKDLMLFRSLNDIYETIRDFWVYVQGEAVVGCCALHVDWEDLAEIRSTVVDESVQKQGIGKALVEQCLEEARELGLTKVFTLTYSADFFKKLGFEPYAKENLPHKVWTDCLNCHKFPDCDEEAMIINV